MSVVGNLYNYHNLFILLLQSFKNVTGRALGRKLTVPVGLIYQQHKYRMTVESTNHAFISSEVEPFLKKKKSAQAKKHHWLPMPSVA